MTTHSLKEKGKQVLPDKQFMIEITKDKLENLDLSEKTHIQEKRKKTILLYNPVDNLKEICIDDFCLLKLLGKGAFGSVYLAIKKDKPD